MGTSGIGASEGHRQAYRAVALRPVCHPQAEEYARRWRRLGTPSTFLFADPARYSPLSLCPRIVRIRARGVDATPLALVAPISLREGSRCVVGAMRFLGVALLPEVEQHNQQIGVVHDTVQVQVLGKITSLPKCEQHHEQVTVVDDVVVVRIAGRT
jgi:hypothetical protein